MAKNYPGGEAELEAANPPPIDIEWQKESFV